ncbi:MAG TPA: hypothetical protein VK785_04710 [Opitutaceae bacterium]|jgi:hypothetical protein|nr:hypothetical protein [Opitutaceae bacterium]
MSHAQSITMMLVEDNDPDARMGAALTAGWQPDDFRAMENNADNMPGHELGLNRFDPIELSSAN